MNDRERVNSRLKALGAKASVFSGKVAVGGRRWRVSVSAVSRLDPESGRQNVHAYTTVARARFQIKLVKKMCLFALIENKVNKMRTRL